MTATTDIMTLLMGDNTAQWIASGSFKLNWGQESSMAGGQLRVADVRSPLWMIDFSMPNMYLEDALDLETLIDALGGSMGTFYAWNPLRPYPKLDPTGSIIGSSTQTILSVGGDNKSMTLGGLPIAYTLSRGDFLSFNYGSPSSRALHRIVTATTTANGSGVTPSFEVTPPFRQGITTGLAVTLAKPTAEFCMTPGSFNPSASGVFQSNTFSAIQVIN